MNNIKVIAVDWEGTIIDEKDLNKKINYNIIKILSRKYKLNISESTKMYYDFLNKLEGTSLWYDYLFIAFYFDILVDFTKVYSNILREYRNLVTVRRDLLSLLKCMKNRKIINYIAIATNSHDYILVSRMIAFDIDPRIFDYRFTSDTFKITKKSVIFYKNILNMLNIKPEEMLVIGNDPLQDIELPRSLGINTCEFSVHAPIDVLRRCLENKKLNIKNNCNPDYHRQ